MKSSSKMLRFGALLAAFMALSAMAGCPKSPELQDRNHRTDGPPDHSGPGAGMGRSTGGGMGGMGMP
jgi:hypothetical protein